MVCRIYSGGAVAAMGGPMGATGSASPTWRMSNGTFLCRQSADVSPKTGRPRPRETPSIDEVSPRASWSQRRGLPEITGTSPVRTAPAVGLPPSMAAPGWPLSCASSASRHARDCSAPRALSPGFCVPAPCRLRSSVRCSNLHEIGSASGLRPACTNSVCRAWSWPRKLVSRSALFDPLVRKPMPGARLVHLLPKAARQPPSSAPCVDRRLRCLTAPGIRIETRRNRSLVFCVTDETRPSFQSLHVSRLPLGSGHGPGSCRRSAAPG